MESLVGHLSKASPEQLGGIAMLAMLVSWLYTGFSAGYLYS